MHFPGTPFEIIYDPKLSDHTSLDNPSFTSFLDFVATKTSEEALEFYDASNACVFLGIDISKEILLSGEKLGLKLIVKKVQDLILNKTREYNKLRDRSEMYILEDALKCMGKPIHNNGCVQFWGLSSDQLRESISSFVLKALSTSENLSFIYVCGDYSFPFGIVDGKLLIVDTHKVTPENGMVCSIASMSKNNGDICDELASLIEQRLLFSLNNKIYTISHEINVVSVVPLQKEVVQTLGIFNIEEILSSPETLDQNEECIDISNMLNVELTTEPDTNRVVETVIVERENVEFEMQELDQSDLNFGDKCISSTPNSGEKSSTGILKPFQEDICNRVLKDKQDCLLVWATGSGKTFTVLNIIQRMQDSVVILVPTLVLLIDLCKQLDNMNLSYGALSSLHCHGSTENLKSTLLSNKPQVFNIFT